MKKSVFITVTVVGVAALAAGLGVLIWWLVTRGDDDLTTIVLEGEGLGDIQYTAAIARMADIGDMFWWFFPSEGANPTTRPILLWLDGVTGLPPSLLANFAMFGPLDFNLNRRNDSWVNEYNLLFVDAPLGTGFSTFSSANSLAFGLDDDSEDMSRRKGGSVGSGSTGGLWRWRRRRNAAHHSSPLPADHLLSTLESFFSVHEEYQNAPLYVFSQGDGARTALELVSKLTNDAVPFEHNLQGIVLNNPIVSPALTLSKLGFYLDEMGYVDPAGRVIVEQYANELQTLVSSGSLEEAFDKFLTLDQFLNEEAGCIAVNTGHILQRLTLTSARDTVSDYFGLRKYLRSELQLDLDFNSFMAQTVAPAVGLPATTYDANREIAIQAVREFYMDPTTELVEDILESTNIPVTICNGNLDAVSTIPGQLEWVNSLQWSGQSLFTNSPRQTLVVNSLVQGYFRETDRLTFYWINAAGVSIPLDSPDAMRRVLERITGN